MSKNPQTVIGIPGQWANRSEIVTSIASRSGGYLLVEKPNFNDGEIFSIAADAPRYRLFHEDCKRFEAGDLFHNPCGVWKMVPA
jgi:hypothetical protein